MIYRSIYIERERQRDYTYMYVVLSKCMNEREEFVQETQRTQQTATRTAQTQDKKTT